jgi:hypothetical protein
VEKKTRSLAANSIAVLCLLSLKSSVSCSNVLALAFSVLSRGSHPSRVPEEVGDGTSCGILKRTFFFGFDICNDLFSLSCTILD